MLEIEPCPFCGVPLTISGGLNPYGRCDTEGCWLHERKISIPLDDPKQVAGFNIRARHIPTSEGTTRHA